MKLFTIPFHALGGPNEVQLYASSELEARVWSEAVIGEVRAIEKRYSRYIVDSIISKINENASKEAVAIDEETGALLDFAAACYKQSDGLFDITSGVLRRAWDFKSGRLPSASQIEELLPLIGWDKVEWRKPYFRLAKAGMQIDFGGIGKEYAVDKACTKALELGVTSMLINLGGDVRALAPQKGREPWRVGIAHPRKENEILTYVELFQGALATSGDYERYMVVDEKRYCHILNPKSGFPVSELQSVSVLSDSCLMAGTAATTTMLFGEKRGERYLKELGLPYIIVNSNGERISRLKTI